MGRYCVIIPAVEAAGTIGPLVGRIARGGLPVLVVDDGSRDATAVTASREGATVISHLRNLGKGCALRTGFAYALRFRYEGVVTMDSDGQHDPDDIPLLLQAGESHQAGIVVGNRLANGHVMPPARRWTNALMSWVVSGMAGTPIPDSQCGFRFIRRDVLEGVTLHAARFEIETELLLAAARRWKIVSVPVRTIYGRERSRIRPAREAVRFLGVLARQLLQRGRHGV